MPGRAENVAARDEKSEEARYRLYHDLRWLFSQPSGIGPMKQRRVVRWRCSGEACCWITLVSYVGISTEDE